MGAKKAALPSLSATIDAYEPRGAWRGIDALVKRIRAEKPAAKKLAAMFRLIERFPESDGSGALLALRHDIEATPGYEKALVASLTRTPSLVGTALGHALQNDGTKRVGAVDLRKLLKKVESGRGGSPKAKTPAGTKSARGAGIELQDLGSVLGKERKSKDVAALTRRLGVSTKVWDQDEMGGFLGCTKTGFCWTFDEDGVLDAVLVPPGVRDKERTTVTLPHGLTLKSSRADVRSVYGKPKRTGNYKPGQFNDAFDTFERDGWTLMFTYVPDVTAIASLQYART